MKTNNYFPLFVNLKDKEILVVGGGKIATRRILALSNFTRKITCVAPQMTKELIELGELGKIKTIFQKVNLSHLENKYIVIAATNDNKINDDIYILCKEQGIYVNVADDKDKCDFYFPGLFIYDDIVVGITTSGKSPKLAKKVREAISKALNEIEDDNE